MKTMTNNALAEMEATAAQIHQPNEQQLSSIAQLAEEKFKLERQLETFAEQVKRITDRLSQIENVLLPEKMSAVGMEEFVLSSGYRVTVSDYVRGSIPTETAIESAEGVDKEALLKRRLAALKWLRAHNAASLIKNKITVEFGKGQDKLAARVFDQLNKKGYSPSKDENVNYQTLNAFLRESIRDGLKVPAEPFALFVGRKAEIKAPKKSK